MSEEKCKYLGENWGDCWRVSGNIFQKCISKNKEKCILLKNEQLHDKIDNLEQQLQTAKEENEKLTKNASGYLYQKRVNQCIDLEVQIADLTQQNKQMREALITLKGEIKSGQKVSIAMNIVEQALKGVNNEK